MKTGDNTIDNACKAYVKKAMMLGTQSAEYMSSYKVCYPLQLFKKPHPPKRVRSRLNGDNMGISIPPGVTGDKIFFHHLDNLRPSLTPVKGKMVGTSSRGVSLRVRVPI